jgi:integrase
MDEVLLHWSAAREATRARARCPLGVQRRSWWRAVGPLFCIVNGPTRGRPWTAGAARPELRRVAREAGVRRRFAPHQLRHAHAVEMAREGVPLIVIQRQLGHTNLGITSIYLQGIDNTEIIDTVHARCAPMVPVDSSLRR